MEICSLHIASILLHWSYRILSKC